MLTAPYVGDVLVRSLADGAVLARLPADAFGGAWLSPDASKVATVGVDGAAKVWDAASAREIASFGGGAGGMITAAAFSPDGATLATGYFNGETKLWPAGGGASLATLAGHRSQVYAVAFSRDGSRLATGSADKMARLWSSSGGPALATFAGHDDWVRSVALSPDGASLLTGANDGTARLWDVPKIVLAGPEAQLAMACAQLKQAGAVALSEADYARCPIVDRKAPNPCGP